MLLSTVIWSDRSASHRYALTQLWNKMMTPLIDIIKAYHNSLYTRLLTQLNITISPTIPSPNTSQSKPLHRLHVTLIDRNGRREMSRENMRQIESQLSTCDFFQVQRVELHKYNFQTQLQIIANTNILIGTHGNGLSHVYWMKRSLSSNTVMAEIFPPHTFTTDYQLLAAVRNIRHFAWDAAEGYWNGSELFLGDRRCADEVYMPYGTVNKVETYHINNIEEFVEMVVKASLSKDWSPSYSKIDNILSCRGIGLI